MFIYPFNLQHDVLLCMVQVYIFTNLSVPIPSSLYLPKYTITSNHKTLYTPDAYPVPDPMAGGGTTKCSPLFNVRSNVSDPLGPYPTITLSLCFVVPINTPTPVITNAFIYPAESFRTVLNYIIEAIPFLVLHIYCEPETVLLQLEELRQ